MASFRTEEELDEIVKHCVELEKSGGDIYAYLRSQNYVTPRATWLNLQRERLNRRYPNDPEMMEVRRGKHETD